MPDPPGGLDLDRFSLRGLGIGLTGGGGHLGREMALIQRNVIVQQLIKRYPFS